MAAHSCSEMNIPHANNKNQVDELIIANALIHSMLTVGIRR